MINQLIMKVQFQNLPSVDSKDYDSLMTKILDGVRQNKYRIINMQSDTFDKAYYAFQMDLYYKLTEHKDVIMNVSPKEIPYDMYERFSNDYGLSLDMSVGKYGYHIRNCMDAGKPEYYNVMNTCIQDGKIVSRAFSHADADGVCENGSELHIPKVDMNRSFVDLYSALYNGSFMSNSGMVENVHHQLSDDFQNVYE